MLLRISALVGIYVLMRFGLVFFRRGWSWEVGTWGMALIPSMFIIGLIDADVLPVPLLIAQLAITGLATWDAHRPYRHSEDRGVR